MGRSSKSRFRNIVAAIVGCGACLAAHAFGEPDSTFTTTTVRGQWCGAATASADGTLWAPVSAIPSTPVQTTEPSLGVAKIKSAGGVDDKWAFQGIARVATNPHTLVYIPPRALPLPDGSVLHLREHVTRFDPDGMLVPAYEQNQLADPLSMEGSAEYALRNDGALVALIMHTRVDPYLGMVSTPALTAVRPDGRRDTSFGSNGYVDLLANASWPVAWSTYSDGTVQATYQAIDANGRPRLTLHRFPVDFDASSAPRGVVPVDGTASWIDPRLAVDAQGRVYVVQGVYAPGPSTQAGVALYRFTTAGDADPGFGTDGRAFTPITPGGTFGAEVAPGALWRTAGGGFEVVFRLAYHVPLTSTIYSLRLAKLRADGTPDPSFTQGTTLEANGSTSVNRLPDGRLAYATTTPEVFGCTAKRFLGDAPAEGILVEYYKASSDHYFMTLEGGESVLLDQTPAGNGWARTGRTFGAWMPSSLEGTKRLCRFYGDLTAGPDSHFYTPEGSECDGLRTLDSSTPQGQAAWRFEGYAGNVAIPVDGACAANLTPIYRLYNRAFEQGGVPNHRYTSAPAVYADMQAKGWAGEGVAFCVPPIPNNVSN